MATEGERLATVEAALHELRGDVLEIKQESYRSRERLHKIEGGQALLISRDSVRADVAKDRNKKMDRRLQLVVAVVTLGVFINALFTQFLHGR